MMIHTVKVDQANNKGRYKRILQIHKAWKQMSKINNENNLQHIAQIMS